MPDHKPETAAEVLAESIKTAIAHEKESGEFSRSDVLLLIAFAQDAVEALSAQGDVVASPLDLSAPPKVWLQIDTNGDAEDRSEAIQRTAWGDLTWCYESIGGQEVVYIRADLAHPAPARVTEEMVERACAAAHPGWPTARPDDDRNRMRSALTAALEDGSHG